MEKVWLKEMDTIYIAIWFESSSLIIIRKVIGQIITNKYWEKEKKKEKKIE